MQSVLVSYDHIFPLQILPQAICTRYGMLVGASMAPFVRVLLMLFYPIAYPISKVLNLYSPLLTGSYYWQAGLAVCLNCVRDYMCYC